MEVAKIDGEFPTDLVCSNGNGFRHQFSREGSMTKNPHNVHKTHTLDGAKIVQNGKVYRQIFDAQVQLSTGVEEVRYDRTSRPPTKVVRSNRVINLPVVNNLPPGQGMLFPGGQTWSTTLPNEPHVENPVYTKQMTELSILQSEAPETEHWAQEVHDLPDLVQPAKLNSDIIDRIIEKRREKHSQLMEDLHQELSQISKNLEPRISEACDRVATKLIENDTVLDAILKPLETDDSLLNLTHVHMTELWKHVVKQTEIRQSSIKALDNELKDIENERILLLRNTLSYYSDILERSSHMAPADLHKIIDDEVMELNQNLLANRRAYSDLYTRLMLADVEREHKQHIYWQARVDDWRRLNTQGGIQDFRDFMCGGDIVNPPGVTEVLGNMAEMQRTLCENRLGLLSALMEELKPPTFNKAFVYNWNQRMVEVCKQIDRQNQLCVKEVHKEYEKVTQICFQEMGRLKAEMTRTSVCNEEEAEEVLRENCMPLIGERQRVFEQNLQAMDDSYEKASQQSVALLKSLFKFCEGAAHLWDRHELGLQDQERKLADRLDASRANQDSQNREKEAALDLIMDRMRQEAGEAGLKDCLKKANDMMEKIKNGYHQFHNQQVHVVKGYPGMVDGEVDSFEKALCKFFGVAKEDSDAKKRKSSKTLGPSSPTKSRGKESSGESLLDGQRESAPLSGSVDGEGVEPVKEITRKVKSKKAKGERDVIVTLQGTRYVVVAPAKAEEPSKGKEDGLPVTVGFIEAPPPEAEEGEEEDRSPGVVLDSNVIIKVKKEIRKNIISFIEEWRAEAQQKSHTVVTAKGDELESELKLREHLHEPRGRRAELDVHNVRAAELVLHNERVQRHCKAITQSVNDLRSQLTVLNDEHNRTEEQFRTDLEALDETFTTATKSSKLSNMTNQLSFEVNKFMEKLRVSLRQFRQRVDEKHQMLREANARFIKSFKLFSEGGNFCPEEVDDYRKRLEKMGQKIDGSESGILSELEGIEKRRQDQVTAFAKSFEDRFKHHLIDLVFMEKIARWLTNTQVKVKAEVANCNSQAQKLADMIASLERRIDACEHPNLDKEVVTPAQLKAGLIEIFRACHDRSLYLNCIRVQVRPVTPAQVPQGAAGSGMRVMFSEPTPLSRIGRQPGEDQAIGVIRGILRTQRERVGLPEDWEAEMADGQKMARKKSTKGESLEALDASVHGSSGDTAAPTKKPRKQSGGGSGHDEKRRGSAARTQFVGKNQRLDKKYLVFGEEAEENDDVHLLGRITGISREALDGMLYIAEMYYRNKGFRAVTRPQSLQENFDQCADVIIKKLQSYCQQADEYHNTCLQEFRRQLVDLENLVAHIPPLVMQDMMRLVLSRVRAAMVTIDEESERKRQQLEECRTANEGRLGPSLGHPNRSADLAALCAEEEARQSAARTLTADQRSRLRAAILEGGQSFAQQTTVLGEQLLLEFDNLITVDEVERGKVDPTLHPTTELMRRQYKGEALENDPSGTLIPRGKHNWPGVPVAEFMALEDQGAEGSTQPASVITAKTTMGHNSTVEARDGAMQEFRKQFKQLLQDVDHLSYKLGVEEQRWAEHWKTSVETVKELY